MGSPILVVQGVTFHRDGAAPCLHDISFSLNAGERVALLGANGTGKTTLLRILNGLLFAGSGEVSVLGTPLLPDVLGGTPFGRTFRKEVGFLFQNSDAQLFNATVEEEIAFGPLQTGWPRDEVARRIQDVMALLGIEALGGRSPGELSGGEKRKVALASLLVLSPSLLLLDEPTAGLDPRSQGLILEILEDLHGRGVTVVSATHDLEALPHLADRAIVLGEDHRVAADGPVHAIIADESLLARANLLHAHRHRHGSVIHRHAHAHVIAHDHPHEHGDGRIGQEESDKE